MSTNHVRAGRHTPFKETPRAIARGAERRFVLDEPRGYFLAWQDADGGGIEEQYRTLGDAVERGEVAQRWIEAGGNASRRRYEVRERVYGRVVWRAMMQERRVGR